MVEHIPLSVDLADAAMGVATGIGRSDDAPLFVGLSCPTVDNRTPVGPWPSWLITIGIGQCVVGFGERELTVGCPPTIDKHVLILDLSDG